MANGDGGKDASAKNGDMKSADGGGKTEGEVAAADSATPMDADALADKVAHPSKLSETEQVAEQSAAEVSRLNDSSGCRSAHTCRCCPLRQSRVQTATGCAGARRIRAVVIAAHRCALIGRVNHMQNSLCTKLPLDRATTSCLAIVPLEASHSHH